MRHGLPRFSVLIAETAYVLANFLRVLNVSNSEVAEAYPLLSRLLPGSPRDNEPAELSVDPVGKKSFFELSTLTGVRVGQPHRVRPILCSPR
jgi:hypothetical protein